MQINRATSIIANKWNGVTVLVDFNRKLAIGGNWHLHGQHIHVLAYSFTITIIIIILSKIQI